MLKSLAILSCEAVLKLFKFSIVVIDSSKPSGVECASQL